MHSQRTPVLQLRTQGQGAIRSPNASVKLNLLGIEMVFIIFKDKSRKPMTWNHQCSLWKPQDTTTSKNLVESFRLLSPFPMLKNNIQYDEIDLHISEVGKSTSSSFSISRLYEGPVTYKGFWIVPHPPQELANKKDDSPTLKLKNPWILWETKTGKT